MAAEREAEEAIIGSDESLKGDTFGGIVVAAVKADNKTREELKRLGVRDSKRISDRKIRWLAEKIKRIAGCKIKSIFPLEYNEEKRGISSWLNKLHKDCYDYLKPGKHIVDKYPGCKVGELQAEKAEDKYLEVGAASILARAAALKQLDELSRKAGFELPKGSTQVKGALEELKKRKLNFKEFVKMDFNNVKDFLKEQE